MSNLAIKVENLGKIYRIGARQGRYRTFREAIIDSLAAPFRRVGGLFHPLSAIRHPQSNDTIWALKDVSFEVRPGEVLGVIGRNGAGKSTLLKVLTRITEPTEGRAQIRGRVSSLLEVATGFHPELTGRENIFLNGAILGMRRSEIGRKFDEILAFAEMEKFVDTPVKRYSSGMFARLAFAVAAHMEPDILLVDEVLAVGDVEFQKKCLGKMGQVASGGRTVLFVSHNMGTVAQLCSRALLLESGRLKQVGEPHLVIEQYLASFAPNVQSLPEGMGRTGTGAVRVQDLSLLSGRGERTHSILSGEDLVIRISVRSMREKVRFVVSIHICDEMGTPIIYSCDQGSLFAVDGKGELIIEATLGSLYLAPGVYFVSIVLDRSGCEIYDKVTNAARFEVNQGPRVPLQDVWHRGWGAVFSPPRFRVLRHELPRPLQEGHRRPLRS